jgi:hypothetical protein
VSYWFQLWAQVNGKPFYLDADNFADKDLLALLTPVGPSPPPVAEGGGAAARSQQTNQ